MSFFKKKRKKRNYDFSELDFNDVMSDAKNISNINKINFDDIVETPLKAKSLFVILFLFSFIFIIFISRIFYLQIIKHDYYKNIASHNKIKTEVIFEKRGVIKDRKGILLAWNEEVPGGDFFKRKYLEKPGFSHLVGYIKYPNKDKRNIYYQKEYSPKTGIEKIFNNELKGVLGKKIININSGQKKIANIYRENAVKGKNITLSIDAEAQTLFSESLAKFLNKESFSGGAIVVIDIENGEIIIATSYPEYNQNILTDGSEFKIISDYFKDKRRPSLARFTYGSYAPGSIIKPFIALAALKEKIITPEKIIHTTGKLVVNDANNRNKYTFYDWKNHGDVNLYSAIANSSNIYFYILGGGFGDIKGLGIERIKKYLTSFGFGKKTGIYSFVKDEESKVSEKKGLIPDKEWKEKTFNEKWYLGNTYYTAIGQYSTLVTPMQVVVAMAAIANNGEVLVPKLKKDSKKEVKRILDFSKDDFEAVKKGMRGTVLNGTAKSLNFDFLKIAAKTGTAELGAKRERVNSWVTGFFPYDNPKYAFVVLADSGPSNKANYVSLAWSKMLKELHKKNPNHIFFKYDKKQDE